MPEQNPTPPRILIFGRTNVGKSTLFNRVTESSRAIVSDIAGTTRDSNIATGEWRGHEMEFIDSGGIMDIAGLSAPQTRSSALSEKEIDNNVQAQAREHIARADFILFVVDARSGLLPADRELASFLQKTLPSPGKLVLVANKADNPRLRTDTGEFAALGLGDPMLVSATSGSGTGDLLDLVADKLFGSEQTAIRQPAGQDPEAEEPVKVSIIGKPNVGKSSLANSLLGENRIIVSSVPHTTREPQDILVTYQNRKITLVDTAGISKQGRKEAKRGTSKDILEEKSILRSLKSLKRSSVALLVLDISQDITKQDAKLTEEIIKSGNSFLIIANKWDLATDKDTKKHTRYIQAKLPFAAWAPILFVSAQTGEKVQKIPDMVLKLDQARKHEVNENYLAKVLVRMLKKQSPRRGGGGRRPYIHALKQTATDPPAFTVRIGQKDALSDNYLRFMENFLRQELDFFGTPIRIRVTRGKANK